MLYELRNNRDEVLWDGKCLTSIKRGIIRAAQLTEMQRPEIASIVAIDADDNETALTTEAVESFMDDLDAQCDFVAYFDVDWKRDSQRLEA